jgi:hypothetical protein
VNTKDKFVVAVKEVSSPGHIKPGKILGSFRKREFAARDRYKLASRECPGSEWKVAIFHNGKCVD